MNRLSQVPYSPMVAEHSHVCPHRASHLHRWGHWRRGYDVKIECLIWEIWHMSYHVLTSSVTIDYFSVVWITSLPLLFDDDDLHGHIWWHLNTDNTDTTDTQSSDPYTAHTNNRWTPQVERYALAIKKGKPKPLSSSLQSTMLQWCSSSSLPTFVSMLQS